MLLPHKRTRDCKSSSLRTSRFVEWTSCNARSLILRLWLAFLSDRPDFAELVLLAPDGWRRNVRENHPLLCGLGDVSL